MKIGFDFDNTIVAFDKLFHKVGVEQDLIPKSFPESKIAIRDHLRNQGKEEIWTEMQGFVYGKRILEADPYPQVLDFMKLLKDNSINMTIISHKTAHPFLGKKYNLHKAARSWIDLFLKEKEDLLLSKDDIFFELTKEKKILRIAKENCDYFIDDLPEIFNLDGFPKKTKKILFDPENKYSEKNCFLIFQQWQEIKSYFLTQWRK